LEALGTQWIAKRLVSLEYTMHCKRLVSLGKSLSMQCIAKKTCKPWVRTLRKKGAQLRQKEEEEEEEEEEFYRGVEV
jgi:hypothetical protein